MTGPELRAWREARGWSQQALADALGVTQPAVSYMESGARPVTRRTVKQLELLAEREPVRPG